MHRSRPPVRLDRPVRPLAPYVSTPGDGPRQGASPPIARLLGGAPRQRGIMGTIFGIVVFLIGLHFIGRLVAKSSSSSSGPAEQERTGQAEHTDEFVMVDEETTMRAVESRWNQVDQLLDEASLDYGGTQGRHGLYVVVGSIILAEYGCPTLWQWVIDHGAKRLSDSQFEEFVREPDVREGLRRLYYDTSHYTLNENIEGLSSLTQTQLLLAARLESPEELP